MTTLNELNSYRNAVMSNPMPNSSEIRKLRAMEAELIPTLIGGKVYEKTTMHPTQYVLEYSDGTVKEVKKSTFMELMECA